MLTVATKVVRGGIEWQTAEFSEGRRVQHSHPSDARKPRDLNQAVAQWTVRAITRSQRLAAANATMPISQIDLQSVS
jgi:hypothetical protein